MNKTQALGILGLKADATADEIKSAYRKAAQQHHPDKGGDEAKFKEIKSAYELLTGKSQPEKEQGFSGFGGFGSGGQTMEDFIHAFMNQQRHQGTRIYQTQSFVQCTLQEAFDGCKRTVNAPEIGQEKVVNIPPGAHSGQQLHRMEGNHHQPGAKVIIDIFLKIVVPDGGILVGPSATNDLYEVGNVIIPYYVNPFLMMTGGEISYTTLDKKNVSVRIPAGLEANKKLKLKGQGYWRDSRCQTRGDLFLVAIPAIKKLGDYPVEMLMNFIGEIEKFYPGEKNASNP